MKKFSLCSFLIFALADAAYSQANRNILPQSFVLSAKLFPKVPEAALQPFSAEYLQQLDLDDAKNDRLPKIARNVTTDFKLTNSGTWVELPGGGRVWRLLVTIPGALGLVPLFDSLYLPQGATLHVYMPDREETLGAFTHDNTPQTRAFNCGLIHGETCIIEYYEPASQKNTGILSINKIGYAYRWVESLEKSVDSGSGSCEVNVVCSPEGNNWRNQIRSVVRIFLVDSTGEGYCSGSLINNARLDCTPYILSAGHCTDSGQVSAPLFEQWVFSFNYETSTCPANTCQELDDINGCTEIAYSDDQNGENGSDFLLLRLSSIPPSFYNVFYSGWDRTDNPSLSGVGVHHPEGDCKKISTYDSAAISASWGNTIMGTHWLITWVQTPNGWGISEPGSSGSPMYNQNGLIVGHLTGGSSCCVGGACGGGGGPNSPDLFGKIWYDWTFNGATPAYQLQPWLDPDNTGIDSLPGMNPPCGVDTCGNDAGIADILIPQNTICQSNFTPQILLRNFGNNPLTSVTIEYVYGSGTVYTQAWTGNLAPGTDEPVDLPAVVDTPGNYSLTVETLNPNGHTDCNPANDDTTINYTVFPPGGSINLFLSTDNSGSQVTWQLTTQNGTLVASGGPYVDELGGKQYSIPLCVSATCFIFTIFDAGGNGMTAGEDGYFQITGPGGYPIYASLNNADFGSKESFNICVLPSGIDEVSLLNFSVFPNPSSGVFNLQFENGDEKTIRVFDAIGRLVLTRTTRETNFTINLSACSSGIYLLQVACGDKSAVRKMVLK